MPNFINVSSFINKYLYARHGVRDGDTVGNMSDKDLAFMELTSQEAEVGMNR